MVNEFIQANYTKIIKMAKAIVKNSEAEEVAHECIIQFLTHKKAIELIERNEAMKYLSGMIHLSYHSKTSGYHKKYRTDKPQEYNEVIIHLYNQEDYNQAKDDLITEIESIMNEKTEDTTIWYNLTLLKLYANNPNYSVLSRETKIPRNAITQAVKEGIEYVKNKINK
jgi:hypothetical protein